MPDERLLRMEEVAARLGISYHHVRMLVLYDKSIPHFRVGSRGIRIKEEDLNTYIAKLENKKEKEEQISGSQDDTVGGVEDTREPYTGRNVLQANQRRDKPPGAQ